MNINKRLALITRNAEEIITLEELKDLLKNKKMPVAYVGMAPTGRIHIGYFIPIMKIRDFLNAGFKFKILLADIHAHLDDRKAPFELLDKRVKYYEEILTLMLKSVNADIKNLEFVKGSSFQLQEKYTLDMYRLAALNTFDRCKRAASEVVRFGDNPKLSGFIYPIMQALDEVYLKVDIQLGGTDQRKILMFARENLPYLGYKSRIEIMTPMLPGLTGTKMSASDKKSKIDLLDSLEDVKNKINKAHCTAGEIRDNGVLAFLQYVIFVLKEDKGQALTIERPEKFGGNLEYKSYKELERDFVAKKLHPLDVKNALAKEINILLAPIRKGFKKKDLIRKAYPED